MIEGLEEKAAQLGKKYFPDEENVWARANIEASCVKSACLEMAKWLLEGAFECTVYEDAGGYPYINQIELYDYDKDEPIANKGDKIKVLIVR